MMATAIVRFGMLKTSRSNVVYGGWNYFEELEKPVHCIAGRVGVHHDQDSLGGKSFMAALEGFGMST